MWEICPMGRGNSGLLQQRKPMSPPFPEVGWGGVGWGGGGQGAGGYNWLVHKNAHCFGDIHQRELLRNKTLQTLWLAATSAPVMSRWLKLYKHWSKFRTRGINLPRRVAHKWIQKYVLKHESSPSTTYSKYLTTACLQTRAAWEEPKRFAWTGVLLAKAKMVINRNNSACCLRRRPRAIKQCNSSALDRLARWNKVAKSERIRANSSRWLSDMLLHILTGKKATPRGQPGYGVTGVTGDYLRKMKPEILSLGKIFFTFHPR